MNASPLQYQELERALHQEEANKVMSAVASARQDALGLQYTLDSMGIQIDDWHNITAELKRRIVSLSLQIQVLSSAPWPSIKSLGQGLLTFLRLELFQFKPVNQGTSISLGLLAEDLRRELTASATSLCCSSDLIIWQLFVGAVAADESSETKAWFTGRLCTVLTNLRMFSWEDAFGAISRGFMPDTRLITRFKDIWAEVVRSDDSQEGTITKSHVGSWGKLTNHMIDFDQMAY